MGVTAIIMFCFLRFPCPSIGVSICGYWRRTQCNSSSLEFDGLQNERSEGAKMLKEVSVANERFETLLWVRCLVCTPLWEIAGWSRILRCLKRSYKCCLMLWVVCHDCCLLQDPYIHVWNFEKLFLGEGGIIFVTGSLGCEWSGHSMQEKYKFLIKRCKGYYAVIRW